MERTSDKPSQDKHGGARPKTSTPTKTPTKKALNVDLSPKSKDKICVLCSTIEQNPKYRFKLFKKGHGFEKTEACERVEVALDISIQSLLYGDMICRMCDAKIKRIVKADMESSKLKMEMTENYLKTVRSLKEKFGRTSTKRLMFSDSPEKTSKKVTTIDSSNKENMTEAKQRLFADKESKEKPSHVWVGVHFKICLFLFSNYFTFLLIISWGKFKFSDKILFYKMG